MFTDSFGLLVCGFIFLLILILSLVLLNGHGAFLISGYNMLSEEKKAKYNEKALCRFVGKLLLVIDFLLCLAIIAGIYEIDWLVKTVVAAIFIYSIGSIIYANTNNRFKL